MTGFWRSWMTGWCWAVVAFGAVLTGAAAPATEGPARTMLAMLGGGAVAFDAPLRFAVALMGAVTLGWGLTLLVATRAADRSGPEVWRGITAAVLAWYAVDGVLSGVTGFALNAVSNTVFLAAFLLPVLRSGVLRAGAPGRPLRA